jgi:hypothetical protein
MAALSIAAMVFWLSVPRGVVETDSFFHLAVGREVVTRGVVPRTDPFSYTVSERPWMAHEWLFGVMEYALYRVGGVSLVAWAVAALTALTILLCGQVAVLSGCNRLIAQLLAQGYAVLLLAALFSIRPHMLSALFLVTLLALLAGFQRSFGLIHLVGIVIVFAVWANTHGAFFIGFALLATVLVDLRGKPAAPGLALAGLAALAACCLNPYGYHLLLLPREFQRHYSTLLTIAEWRPPGLECPWQMGFSLVGLGVMLAGYRSCSLGGWLRIALCYALWFSARRHLLLVAAVTAPALGVSLSRLLDRFPEASWKLVPARPLEWFAGWGLALVLTLPLAVFKNPLAKASFPRTSAYVLKTQPQATGRIFHEGEAGGYLIWELGPARKVFIDWRAELYADTPIIPDYNNILEAGPWWESMLKSYQVEWVLVYQWRPLAKALSRDPGWKQIGIDGLYVLFRRNRGR